MPSLIYVAPETAHWTPVSTEQYAALVEAMGANPDASNLKIDDASSGSVTFQKIDFKWTYAAELLQVIIVADHNWKAELAGNEAVFATLDKKLIAAILNSQA
jgi:hypothetical protein